MDDQRSEIVLQFEWDSEGLMEKLGSAIGQDDRRVKGELERFKELIESRGAQSGAWRDEVEQGARTR